VSLETKTHGRAGKSCHAVATEKTKNQKENEMISLKLRSAEFAGSTNGVLTVGITRNDLADSIIDSLRHEQLDDLLKSIITNRGIGWMISEITRNVVETYDVPTEDVLQAVIRSVRALSRHQDDLEIRAALDMVRMIVGGAI
jgi:hypothetical protein